MASKILHLYLDVDGVLNCDTTEDRVGRYLGVDPILAQNLKYLITELEKQYEVRIILSSTWRNYWYKDNKAEQDAFANRLDAALAEEGLKIYDRLPNESLSKRGHEIQQYLTHNSVDQYLILDDNEYEFWWVDDIWEHFIHTNEQTGLTKWTAQIALWKLQELENDQEEIKTYRAKED